VNILLNINRKPHINPVINPIAANLISPNVGEVNQQGQGNQLFDRLTEF
jgi:hypothetical protein